MKNEVFYTKTIRIRFPIKGLLLTNIPVLQSVQLSFFEKFIILMLQRGIRAKDKETLINDLSTYLNVSYICVGDFIDFLISNELLKKNKTTNVFKLDESVTYTLDSSKDNAMFAQLGVKKADCNSIVLMEDLNEFRLDIDFSNDIFKRKSDVLGDSLSMSEKEINLIEANRNKINSLISRHFENSNAHVQSDFSFEYNKNFNDSYEMEFEALINYKYNKESKISEKEKVVVRKDINLPQWYIDKLSEIYAFDFDIPRFLKLEENFYSKVPNIYDSLDDVESLKENKNEEITNLKSEKDDCKETLKKMEKDHKKTEKELDDKTNAIGKQLDDTENNIKLNNEKIKKANEEKDKEVIQAYKESIKELEQQKAQLEMDLEKIMSDLDEFKAHALEKEKKQRALIEKKDNDILAAQSQLKALNEEHKEKVKEYDNLLNENKKSLNPIINKVIGKYPADNNLLNRRICSMCMFLDSALSASDSESFDVMSENMEYCRESYRKVMTAIFNVFLPSKNQKLGMFFAGINILDLEKVFRPRGILTAQINYLNHFDKVLNAIGHDGIDPSKQKQNDAIINDFIKSTAKDREKYLLSVPTFFDSLKLDSNEVKAIISKLSI